MLSTLYLLQFLAFYTWQLTSKQVKRKQVAGYLTIVTERPGVSRWVSGLLLILLSVFFVAKLGLMSGICAWLVGLMGVGCLSVALEPFRYLHFLTLGVLYAVTLTLEILI